MEHFQAAAAAAAIRNGGIGNTRNVPEDPGIIVTDVEDNDESDDDEKEWLDGRAGIGEDVEVVPVDGPNPETVDVGNENQ